MNLDRGSGCEPESLDGRGKSQCWGIKRATELSALEDWEGLGGGALCTASFLGTPLYKPGGYLLLSDSVLLIYNYQAGIAVSCPTRLFLHQHLHSMHATEMYAPIKCNHAYVQMPQTP